MVEALVNPIDQDWGKIYSYVLDCSQTEVETLNALCGFASWSRRDEPGNHSSTTITAFSWLCSKLDANLPTGEQSNLVILKRPEFWEWEVLRILSLLFAAIDQLHFSSTKNSVKAKSQQNCSTARVHHEYPLFQDRLAATTRTSPSSACCSANASSCTNYTLVCVNVTREIFTITVNHPLWILEITFFNEHSL